jgi:hypothetical protein
MSAKLKRHKETEYNQGMSERVDWNELQKIKEKCDRASVSFVLHYEENTGSYWFEIVSAAKGECQSWSDSSFSGAIELVNKWLDNLIK